MVEEFRISRAPSVVLLVTDPSGRPMANARVEIREISRPHDSPPGRSDTQGRYDLTGLEAGQATVLDISSDQPLLGSTIELDPSEQQGKPKELEVRLKPLVTLSGRVLDEDGRTIANPVIQLFRNVMYPGQSHRSFGVPIDSRNEVAADGTYTFTGVIPGATYNTRGSRGACHGNQPACPDQARSTGPARRLPPSRGRSTCRRPDRRLEG